MVVEPEDRSSFLALAELVDRQIVLFPNATVDALVGESFGGLLALYVASTESPAGTHTHTLYTVTYKRRNNLYC